MRDPELNTRSASASQAACPGLLHIVQAVDGGLCRIKLAGGRLDADQARAVAAAARRHGSGLMEITNRANLQLRGVRTGAAAALIGELTAAGLGPLPAQDQAVREARDRRRNVMISPTAGIDMAMRLDTSRLADALLLAMQRAPDLDALSPKFALLLDGGERLADLGHPQDIWLRADPQDGDDVPGLWLGLASAADKPSPDTCLGRVAAADAVDTVMALLHAFVELAGPARPRMRDLLADGNRDILLARAGRHGARLQRLPPPHWPHIPALTASARAAGRLGVQRQIQPGRHWVGFQAPLARLDAAVLEGLATLIDTHGADGLRLSPWQGGLLTGLDLDAARRCLAGLRRLGLIGDPASPLVRLQACAGRLGCARSPVDTKADARWLASGPLPDAGIHLSGCARSCAAASAADFTLLALAGGHYDLHRRGDGPGPGPRLASRLTLEQAAVALAGLGAEAHDV